MLKKKLNVNLPNQNAINRRPCLLNTLLTLSLVLSADKLYSFLTIHPDYKLLSFGSVMCQVRNGSGL